MQPGATTDREVFCVAAKIKLETSANRLLKAAGLPHNRGFRLFEKRLFEKRLDTPNRRTYGPHKLFPGQEFHWLLSVGEFDLGRKNE